MLTTDAFSREDTILLQEISLSFRRFLIHLRFDGDYRTAVCFQRELEKDPIIDKVNISSVHMFMAWKLCFGRDVRPLWLTSHHQTNSPITVIKSIVEKLGIFAPLVQECDRHILRFNNGNQLNASTFFPQAGCGLSLTDLVMEDCPSHETGSMMRRNLCPVLYSVTKGKGRVIEIQ